MSQSDLFNPGAGQATAEPMMNAISLWQPWATAMALRLKLIETRSWHPQWLKPPFRLAIHAAKRWTMEEVEFLQEMRELHPTLPAEMPLGAIVAVTTLVAFRPSEALDNTISDDEHGWGNYSEGRYGWVCEGTIALREPLPWKGRQGFFKVPVAAVEALLP